MYVLLLTKPITSITLYTHRTQAIVEEALQHFVQESNISIVQYSRVLKSAVDNNNAIAGSEEIPVLSDDANLAHLADSVKTESEALTRKRESTLLNSALRVELHREASFYLSTMDGILEGGKHFLPGKYYLMHLPWIMYTQLLL